MSFSIIAAVGQNRELGKDGHLLWHLPDDLKFFKKTTTGHAILMGRKTFDSLPRILPSRKHYVVTRQADLGLDPAVETVNNLPDFIKFNSSSPDEIFVIGGGMVYQEMLEHCNKLYLTEVDADWPDADTFFPEFDKDEFEKEIVGRGEENGIKYVFTIYTRKRKEQNEERSSV